MIQRIPNTPGLPYYDFDIELDSVEYRLEFMFNGRDESWYMSIYSSDDLPMRVGIKVVNNWVLTRTWKNENKMPGEIVSILNGRYLDSSALRGLESLGRTALLNYISEES